MKEINVRPEDRTVVIPAREAARAAREKGKGNENIFCGVALELKDGSIVTGMNSSLMHSTSSLILNATKQLSGIPDTIDLLPRPVVKSLNYLKKDILKGKMASLNVEEILIALSISASSNPAAQIAIEKLSELNGCELHTTHIPTPGDSAGLRKLGLIVTSDPEFPTRDLLIT